MNVVLINNNVAKMDEFAYELTTIFEDFSLVCFNNPLLSAKYIWNNPVDLVFVEERMRPANGIDILRVIRKQKPDMPIVILAEDEHMRQQAKDESADGYWLRPVKKEQLNKLHEYFYRQSEGIM